MKEIPLYGMSKDIKPLMGMRKRGTIVSYTLVDDEEYDRVNQYHWQMNAKGYAYIARKSLFLHRLLLNAPAGIQVDHIDRNKLNNQKSNLRLATQNQNRRNTPKFKTSRGKPTTSNYKGVSLDKRTNRWNAYIGHNSKFIYIGCFGSEIEAAKAYNAKALELFGEFALLNDVNPSV